QSVAANRKPKTENRSTESAVRSPQSAVRSTQSHRRARIKHSIGHPLGITCRMLEGCFEHELDGIFINVGPFVWLVFIWSLVVFLCPLRLLRVLSPTACGTFLATVTSHLAELFQFQPLPTQPLVHAEG